MFRQEPQAERAKPVFRIVTSAGEAEEHLRVIRQAMERSTKHSTLSGLSGVIVGCLALAGCALTFWALPHVPAPGARWAFGGVWLTVLALSIITDVTLTKRRAARVGKTAFSPLGRHLTRAALPGLLACGVLSVFYLLNPHLIQNRIYGIWMVCYAISLLAVGMFSVREVSYLGWAFLAAGAVTLCLPGFVAPALMALAFGGFHIFYGAWMGYKYGW